VSVPLYDDFADYDQFVSWERRLAYELPFVERQLALASARCVLDVACGTAKHAVALAQCGYKVTGADLSAGMVARAKENAAEAGVDVQFAVAGFGDLEAHVGGGFDALLCLGNSLPHVLSAEGLASTLADFGRVLRPGGMLFLQIRNYDRVLARRERWMAPQSRREGEREWLFLRLYDYLADGSLDFSVVTLTRTGEEAWRQRTASTRLWPWRAQELAQPLDEAGFVDVCLYGDMAGAPYDPAGSPNLVVVAIRKESKRRV
jgi:glycine/sarcosine N-methyltransferase